MRSPEDQASGETRQDAHSSIARQQWEELRQSEKNDAGLRRRHFIRSVEIILRPDLFGGGDAATEAPVAPVEYR
jgi:hypothetical protein